MPTISERLVNRQHDPEPEPISSGPIVERNPILGGSPTNALSPIGNPAPNRGLFPPDSMYDFQIAQFYPDTPYFSRGNVGVNIFGDNLALQAYTKAGGRIL